MRGPLNRGPLKIPMIYLIAVGGGSIMIIKVIIVIRVMIIIIVITIIIVIIAIRVINVEHSVSRLQYRCCRFVTANFQIREHSREQRECSRIRQRVFNYIGSPQSNK